MTTDSIKGIRTDVIKDEGEMYIAMKKSATMTDNSIKASLDISYCVDTSGEKDMPETEEHVNSDGTAGAGDERLNMSDW